MNTQKHTRKDDLDSSLSQHSYYNSSEVIGTWYNCDPDSSQIIKLIILKDGDDLYLNAYGSDILNQHDWGKVKILPFVAIPDTNTIGGFTCTYDFEFMETQICSNIKRGILVIQAYNIFKDDSGRPNYYSREFFNQ